MIAALGTLLATLVLQGGAQAGVQRPATDSTPASSVTLGLRN